LASGADRSATSGVDSSEAIPVPGLTSGIDESDQLIEVTSMYQIIERRVLDMVWCVAHN
jgi:hypothetical protein